jgi:diaminopimelate decarboxylase
MMRPLVDDERLFDLVHKYGSPLYVYDEGMLRERCREMRSLLPGRPFRVSYSAKANSNLEILRIIGSEGIDVDAVSAGEIYLQQKAGFSADRIFFIANNVASEELRFAVEKGVLVSVDSLSQLDLFGRNHPGAPVAVRFNPGVGAGHHAKVMTAGASTKFGVQAELTGAVRELVERHRLRLAGVNQHIGSLFLDGARYLEAAAALLRIAREFPGLDFVDFGGGFGVPYREDEPRLDLGGLFERLAPLLDQFASDYDNKDILFRAEPGRYLVAECGLLIGTVHSIKESYGVKYAGTDLGFNVLARPVLYDSYHAIHVAKRGSQAAQTETVTVVGNLCESGDVLARDRVLPRLVEGDLLAVLDAGAYGFSMASSYNCRLLPAEALIARDGGDRLIRKRATLADLAKDFVA